MRSSQHFFLFFFFLALSNSVVSQNSNVYGIFPTINIWGKLSEKVNYELYYFTAAPLIGDVEYSKISNRNWLLMYAEHSLTFAPLKSLSLTGSYVHQVENGYGKGNIGENRFFFQAAHAIQLQKISLKQRLRHDSRFLKNDFKHRIRYQLSCRHDWESGNYFTVGQEFFFELTKGSNKLYNENWLNAGVGIKLNDKNYIELGALSVSWTTAKGTWFNQWYFQPTWVHRFNFECNKKRQVDLGS